MQHHRTFTLFEHFKLMNKAVCGLRLNQAMKKQRVMTKKRRERIMLAISEVNGCALCSFVHTKLALSAHMELSEIQTLLAGDLQGVPTEDVLAVLFAKDFAANHEVIDPAFYEKLVAYYGVPQSRAIVCASHVITMTTSMGISLALLKNTLTFRHQKGSKIWNELLIPLVTVIGFPVLYVASWLSNPLTKIDVLPVEYHLGIGK